MSHSKKMKKNIGTFVPVETSPLKREKRGYKAEVLSDKLIHFFIPKKEDQRFVYISCPLGEDPFSCIERVARYAKKAWENEYVPVCPFLMYLMLFRGGSPQTFANIQMFDLMILMHCHELWVIQRGAENIEDHQIREMQCAAQMDIPVRLVSFDEEDQES